MANGGDVVGATAIAVASRAGVSVSTVSRAFSSPGMVSEATRRRVSQAAEALGYHPQRPGAGVRTRTRNLGLVVPDLENPHFAALAKQVQARARELGFRVFLADTDEDASLEADVVASLADEVDCLILCSARAGDDDVHRFAQKVTLVLVNRSLPPHACVVSDEAGGAREVVRHLAALGHTHLAFAGGPPVSWTGRQRLNGLQAAADELGIGPVTVLGSFQPTVSGGVAAADLFLATTASALVTHNDLMGFGVLNRLADRGVAVPEQASVASFDDILFATLARPALTSAGTLPRSVARAACAMARHLPVAAEATPSGRHHRTIPMNLQVRGSTGPVGARTSAPVDSRRG